MTCYSPLHAYKAKSKDASKIKICFKRGDSWRGERLDLPCGQCVGCRLERSRQWAVRCMHEASLYDENSFITLTYNDEFLPQGGTLVKSHFQYFMKRLRKSIAPRRVRYYHCGEYGENLGRPHYHGLLFNYDFKDKKFFSGKEENRIFTSDELSRLWPFGFSVIGQLTFASANYVARYVMKKITGNKSKDFYGEKLPEYSTMSRRPGIGSRWLSTYMSDVYPLDRVIVRGNVTRPPRYYDDSFGRLDPSGLALVKIEREKKAERYVDDVLSDGTHIRVSDNCMDRLLVREVVKTAEISALRRPLEEV